MARRHTVNEVFWTKDECFRALHAWVLLHGRVPSENSDWHRAGPNHPAGRTAVRHFGSWSGFLRVAGYEPQRAGMKPFWTRDKVADWMLDFLLKNGRWPMTPELRAKKNGERRPSYGTVTKLFGSYTAAKTYAGWEARCLHCQQRLTRARSYQKWCSRACRGRGETAIVPEMSPGCAGCGGDLDAWTTGCKTCINRKGKRKQWRENAEYRQRDIARSRARHAAKKASTQTAEAA